MQINNKEINSIVSIIIPAFNVEQYIESCIVSMQKQTYSNIEMIFVDDKSTDRTSEIIDKYAAEDSRIKVIHADKLGVSGARNAGLKAATGDWIMFCDSDDEYLPDTVEKLLREAVSGDYDVVSGTHNVIKSWGDTKRIKVKPREFHSTEDIVSYFFTDGANNNFVWERIYKRSIFDGLAFVRGRYYEDILFTIDLCKKIERMKVVDTVIYNYYLRNTSLTSGVRKDVHMDALKARVEQLEFAREYYPQYEGAAGDMILSICCFILSKFWAGRVSRTDSDYLKVVEAFRTYEQIADKKSLFVKAAGVVFHISPRLLGVMCKIYSDLKNK